MNGPGRLLLCGVLAISSADRALAQITNRPADPPTVSADGQDWYVGGEPIPFAGNLYYPAGPRVFFNGNEMVRSGSFAGVPLYTRTTIEPFSMVFVPLSGGLLQPYERRRTGELAGTVGSSAPSFPVSVSSQATPSAGIGPTIQAPYSPTQFAPVLGPSAAVAQVLPAGGVDTALPVDAVPAGAVSAPGPVGTSGSEIPRRAAAPGFNRSISAARRAQTANGVFVEFNKERWFISGSPAALPSSVTRIGEVRGFPVYSDGSRPATIYVPLTEGIADVVVPYSRRQGG